MPCTLNTRAGQETSAIQLSWCCAYLAHYPQVQAAAAAEVAAAAAGRPLQVADAGRLPLVEAVVLEAMRCVPGMRDKAVCVCVGGGGIRRSGLSNVGLF